MMGVRMGVKVGVKMGVKMDKRRFLFFNFLISFFLVFLISSCTQTPVVEVEKKSDGKLNERLINANKYIASAEQTQIDGYVSRRGWNCETLPCGARLSVVNNGQGAAIRNDDPTVVCYTLSTLNGKTLYADRTDTLIVGRHNATVALDEALLRMRHGGEAWLISPSEAGYGVAGDGDRIPSRTVLVYHLKVKGIAR